MGSAEFYFRDSLAQEFGYLIQISDARHNVETLTTTEVFAQQMLADGYRIKRRNISAYSQTIKRWRGDQRHFAHTRKCELQSARNWGGSQC